MHNIIPNQQQVFEVCLFISLLTDESTARLFLERAIEPQKEEGEHRGASRQPLEIWASKAFLCRAPNCPEFTKEGTVSIEWPG